MQSVFLVLELSNLEYGCRSVVGAFETEDKANQYIDKCGNQEMLNYGWYGDKTYRYIIEEWNIQ